MEEFLVFMASRTLYKDEDQNIIDAFKQFDRDGNGYIDRDELIFLMESLGITFGARTLLRQHYILT